MPKLTMKDEGLEVVLSGYRGDFAQAIQYIKEIPGRRYDPARKVWILPPEPENAERVMATIRPEMDVATSSWVKAAKAEKQSELITPLPDDAELQLPWASKLYAYQRALVDFAAERRRMIVADDMGGGKTIQALAAIEEFRLRNPEVPNGPRLIISPASVKGVWAREVHKWLGDDYPVQIVDAASAVKRREQLEAGIGEAGFVVVNYEQIRVKTEKQTRRVRLGTRLDGTKIYTQKEFDVKVPKESLFRDTAWLAAVADEAHRAKNRKALTTQGLWQIDAPVKLALTGTPVQNSPDELWALLRWLYPERYNTNGTAQNPKTAFGSFFDEYCDYYETPHKGKVITGVRNPDALRFELKDILKRRTKGEMLDLPPMVRQFIPVELGTKQRKLYKEAEKQLWFEVEKAIRAGDSQAKRLAEAAESGNIYTLPNGAARVVRLRQIASTPATLGGEDNSAKLDAAVELILDAQKQIVVFTAFVKTAHILCERLEAKNLTARYFTGEVTSAERTELEDEFQAGGIDVLVGTLDAMREGITLHASDTAIFLERSWVPAHNEQAESRLHRNGQKESVTILILEATDTVDTGKIAPTNAVKSLIVRSVVAMDEVEEVNV